MSFEQGDVVIFCNKESKIYPAQNAFANEELNYGEVYIVEHRFPGDTPQLELRGHEYMFIEDFFEIYDKEKHRNVVAEGKKEKQNQEIRDGIDNEVGEMHNVDGATYFFYPVESLEGFSGALKYFDDNKRLYVSPSVNDKISNGELDSIEFAILRYRREEKDIEEVVKEIFDELTRNPNDPPPKYSPIFRIPPPTEEQEA